MKGWIRMRSWIAAATVLGGTVLVHEQAAAQSASGVSGGSVPRHGVAARGAGRATMIDPDHNPILVGDGSAMLFNSASRAGRDWAQFDQERGRYDADIYLVRKSGGGWQRPVNVGARINSGEDDGIEAVAADGGSVYFSSLKPGWESDGGPFYRARLEDSLLADPRGLGGGITDFFAHRDRITRFRIYGATISPDGRDFYFATTVGSSEGKHQIWVSHLVDGVWSSPENLGAAINDGDGSYAPRIAADGHALFFQHRDVKARKRDQTLVSLLRDGAWQAPIGADAFFGTAKAGEGYVMPIGASDGSGETDMVSIPSASAAGTLARIVTLTGIVLDNETGRPVRADVLIEDLQTGLVATGTTSSAETGRYQVILNPSHPYRVSVSAPGYSLVADSYEVPAGGAYTEYSKDVRLEKLTPGRSFFANRVLFNYNSATLAPKAYHDLDHIVAILKEYPTARLQVEGHVDGEGNGHGSEQLAEARAEAVRNYLVNVGGIAPERLMVRGADAARPVAPGVTEEERRMNRRCDCVVLPT